MSTEQKKVKLGVVGCGAVALRNYFPFISNDERIELISVCDKVGERAKEAARKFNAKEWYNDHSTMFKKADIETVALLTPMRFHYPQIVEAIQAGKHVYTQKPLAMKLKEANHIMDAAEKKDIKICVSPGQMLDPVHQEIKRIVKEGTIGKVCFSRAHGSHIGHESEFGSDFQYGTDPSWYYKQGGGPVFDVAVYPLHSLTAILGSVKRITSFSGIAIPKRLWKNKEIEVETADNMMMLLDFGDSVFSSLDSSFCMRAANTPMIELYGGQGVIHMNPWTKAGPPLEIFVEKEAFGFPRGWFIPTKGSEGNLRSPGICEDLFHLIDCILEHKSPIPSVEHARHIVEIIEKAYESSRTGISQNLMTEMPKL